MNPSKTPFYKKKTVWIPAAAFVVIVGGGWLAFGRGKAGPAYTVATAKKEQITEQVIVTGNVYPAETIDLGFERVGRITSVATDIGRKVSQGQVLASLDSSAENAGLVSARAKLSTEQARLDEVRKGARQEDIDVTQSDLDKASGDLRSLYANVFPSLLDAYNKAENAINRQVNPLFSNAQTQNPQLTFNVSNQQTQIDAISGRVNAGYTLAQLNAAVNSLASTTSAGADSSDARLASAVAQLASIQSFLNQAGNALTYATNIDQTTLGTYKDGVNTARTNVTAALSSILALSQSIQSQKITVEKSQRALTLKKLGSTDEAIREQQGAVDQAQAALLSAQSAYAKDFLVAPVSGTVTAKNVFPGQIVQGSAAAISLISDAPFQIEADVPETDIAKIKQGDKADVTLDAYGSDTAFPAQVISIDPAEKIIDGVPTYKVTLDFITQDARIRAGMTANLTITTAQKDGVIGVPQRAILTKDTKKYVRILDAKGAVAESEVTTGLRGENGDIEVVSGVKEGDKVITFVQ